WVVITFPFPKTWQKCSVIVFAFHKHVYGFTISIDSATHYFTVLIFFNGWFQIGFCSAFGGFFKSTACIINPKGDYFYTVTVFYDMIIYWRFTVQRRSKNQPDFILLQNITHRIA